MISFLKSLAKTSVFFLTIFFIPFLCSIGEVKNETKRIPDLVFNFRHESQFFITNEGPIFVSCEERYSDKSFRTFIYKGGWDKEWRRFLEIPGCIIQVEILTNSDIIYLLKLRIDERRSISKILIANSNFEFKKEIYITSSRSIEGFVLGDQHSIAIIEADFDFRKERLLIGSTERKDWKELINENAKMYFRDNLLLINGKVVSSKENYLFQSGSMKEFRPEEIDFSENIFHIKEINKTVVVTFAQLSDYIEILESLNKRYRIYSSDKDWQFADSLFYLDGNKMVAPFISKDSYGFGISYRIGVSCDRGKSWILKKHPDDFFRIRSFYIKDDFIYLMNYRNIIKINLGDLNCADDV